MRLSPWAEGDEEGISTYPEALCGEGTKMLHISRPAPSWRALCGMVHGGRVEYLGERRVKVCAKCRKKYDQRT